MNPDVPARMRVVAALAGLLCLGPNIVHAACQSQVGKFVSIGGSVEVQPKDEEAWAAASLDTGLCEGDSIRVGDRSRATVALINESVLSIDESTTIRLLDINSQKEERSWIDAVKGTFQSFSRKPRFLTVNTPYLNGSIEGTEFLVRVEDKTSEITVFEGVVRASNPQGEVAVSQGESATATAGQAPQRRIIVRPRDQVQWSLYYPPILSSSAIAAASPTLSEAATCAAKGDTVCAFAALDRVPAAARDAQFYLLQAATLLSVGRVDQAKADIDRALQLDPSFGQGYALRSVIAVAQNDTAAALTDARRGVELSPDSAAAKIALSYALQADFQIEAARDTMQSAVDQRPDDALAWARLAELELMLGRRSQALAAAERAKAIAPNLARTQLVLGFNALASFRNREAKAAFDRAIAMDSSDPLAHLGLGLAQISSGRLADGRRDVEAAVALDSTNALLRAYLGKAYFEEKRYPLDSQQYAIAKELDPLDPTAYLYDGILKQTINRPVEAVRDLEKSIELNDDRAVYRSRLLLDKDRAARGTSLARAYNDLGFKQLGINEATRSLDFDPANAAPHRFLSDIYLGQPRVEIARVSELLQAQLMQDININPIQPSLAATNLNIVTLGGPATPGFNEYTPLFEQNQAQLNMTGFGGSNDTIGGEAVVSALYDRFSVSAGAFSYDTDGWRPNNDVNQKIFNFYGQWAVTDELNVQAEYGHRNSETGDLEFRFDPEDFIADRRIRTDRDNARFGLRYSPTTASTFLLSYIYNKRDETRTESQQLDPFTTLAYDSDLQTEGSLVEGQYIYEADRFNVLVGGAYSNPDTTGTDAITVEIADFGPIAAFSDDVNQQIRQPRGYVYSNIDTGDKVTWTIGASYDDYQQDPVGRTSINPKAGVRWRINDAYQVRAAAFKVLKPSLVNNQTIEPTQVAGFNQFFDDETGTESWRYGAALDSRPLQSVAWGIALTWREKDVPKVTFTEAGKAETGKIDQDEQLHNVYVYWTPTDRLAVTGQVVYDRFDEPSAKNDDFRPVPERVRTVSAPLGLTYFHPSGVFAGALGTYVNQKVLRSENSIYAQGQDNFVLVDLAVGYRLPRRSGTVSLGVKNLFDEEFRYLDDSFREFSEIASPGPYFPDRIVMANVTLSF